MKPRQERRECLPCLNEPLGICSFHKPPPLTMDEVMALVAEELVSDGIAERIGQNTVRILF